MQSKRTLIIVSTSFAVGMGIGYATFLVDPQTAKTPHSSTMRRWTSESRVSADESPARKSRSAVHREIQPAIQTESNGNFVLPASMVDRLSCSALDGLKADREDLQVLGLSEKQIDQVQQLVDQTLGRCFDREKSVVEDFTISGDEVVRMIPGDPIAAAAEKQRLIDAIELMGGNKKALLDKFLVAELAGITLDFGAEDSFFRASRGKGSGSSASLLDFERLQLFLKPGEPALNPGSNLTGYEKKYGYSSTCRYGGKSPPDNTAHLLQDGQCEHLLRPKSKP